MAFKLPKLMFAYNALEPFIDTESMQIHHTVDHQNYVDFLNKYLESDKGEPYREKSIIEILETATDQHLRDNAGGHYNHSLLWTWMTAPGGTLPAPHGDLRRRIEQDFGSLDKMKAQFSETAASVFGSGWAWMGVKPDGSLGITSTPNQDNPMMNNAPERMIPIMGLDVWEHAYFAKYQTRRHEYISAFWNLANWDKVVEYYDQFGSQQQPVPI